MEVYQFYKEYLYGKYEHNYVNKDLGGGVSITKIEYHSPNGEGDAHYCDVIMSDGTMRRVFRPDNIDLGTKERELVSKTENRDWREEE